MQKKEGFIRTPSSRYGPSSSLSNLGHIKGGGTERGYSHLHASTLSLRAVGPATVLSHKYDILSLLKDDQNVRDNRLPVP